MKHLILPHLQRGFTAVSAIFILVVLAVLGAFIVSVSTQQQVSSGLDVQGVRAYEAARSGIEWGLFQQMRSNNCAAAASFVALAPYTVTVTCIATAPAPLTGGPTVWTVTAVACNQPAGGNCPNNAPGGRYVERRLDVTF